MGLDAADADRAVSAFREYFPTKGLFENEVYPGVPALLADLKAAGKPSSSRRASPRRSPGASWSTSI